MSDHETIERLTKERDMWKDNAEQWMAHAKSLERQKRWLELSPAVRAHCRGD